MKHLTMMALGLVLVLPSSLAAEKLPGDSVYQLPGKWRDQSGSSLTLADLQGKRQLLSMVYTDCEHTCPIIVNNMKQVQEKVDDPECHDTGYVLVSFTPEIDTPEKLAGFADQYDLDACWTLLTSNDAQVRQLAMALSIKYSVGESGYVAHSNLMSVLDERGRLLGQFSGMEKGVSPAVAGMRSQ